MRCAAAAAHWRVMQWMEPSALLVPENKAQVSSLWLRRQGDESGADAFSSGGMRSDGLAHQSHTLHAALFYSTPLFLSDSTAITQNYPTREKVVMVWWKGWGEGLLVKCEGKQFSVQSNDIVKSPATRLHHIMK